MAQPIDFYFDFSSPYGYFAGAKINELAARHGRSVIWRPILLGAVFKITGQQPLPTIPLKGSYANHDLVRSARLFGVPYKTPSKFPVSGTAPSRAFYWVSDKDPVLAIKLAQALYHAYFVEDRDISNPEVTANVAASWGSKGSGGAGAQRPGRERTPEDRSRCRNRARRVRIAVHHRRQGAVLGFGPAGSGGEVARYRRLVILKLFKVQGGSLTAA